jgi:hypothetical protein
MPHGIKGWAILAAAQAVFTVILHWLAKLADNAMLTWVDDQIAMFLGLSQPQAATVISWILVALIVSVMLFTYHAIQSRISKVANIAINNVSGPAAAESGIAHGEANLRELRTKITGLSRSLRARDAESRIKEADQIIMSTYKKLLEGPYPNEAAWARDYTTWETAVKRIDGIMSEWAKQPHKPFLNYEDLRLGAPPPPSQSNIKSDINVTRYKIVWLAQGNYANRRDGIFIFFASKAGELSE